MAGPIPASLTKVPREKVFAAIEREEEGTWQKFGRTIRLISLNLWLWELLGLLTSTLCIGAILVILSMYNEKPVPQWNYGLTINGVVSILAGIAKAAIVLPTAEAVSQLKWCWFWDRRRPVVDFERYDSASRGPWGSLMLLGDYRLWSFVSVGAALTLAAVAIEPSLQQIPTYPLVSEATGISTTARSVYHDLIDYDGSGYEIVSSKMKGAVYTGIFGDNEAISNSIQPSCSTGNCTWPQFTSLGVCHACENITSSLIVGRNGSWEAHAGEIWLPNGNMSLSLVLQGQNLGWMQTGSYRSIAFDQHFANQSMLDLSFIYIAPVDKDKINDAKGNAMECVLWPCVKTYEAAMINGTYNESIVDIWPPVNTVLSDDPQLGAMCNCSWRSGCNEPDDPGSDYGIDWCNPTVHGNLTLNPPHTNDSFAFKMQTYNDIRNWINPIMKMNYRSASDGGTNVGSKGEIDNSQAFYSAMLPNTNITDAWQMISPAGHMKAIADSMTNLIRNTGRDVDAARGSASHMLNVVRVRWQWAIFPVILLLVTLMFLVVTITITVKKGVPIWKSSSLAYLLHGLDDASCRAMTANRCDELESKAKDFAMKMALEDRRWRLKGDQSSQVGNMIS